MKKELLYGLAGVSGIAITTWRTMFPWLNDDLKMIRRFGKLGKGVAADMNNGLFFIDKFEATVKKNPDKTFIIYEDRHYTYRLIDEYANKVANMFTAQGLRFGDVAALYCYNSPQFIFSFLGLLKIGMVVSMINTSLQGEGFAACVNASEAKIVIVGEGEELLNTVNQYMKGENHVRVFFQGQKQTDILHPELISFDELLVYASPAAVDRHVRSAMTYATPGIYIFTSGTTGLPKPVYKLQDDLIRISSIYRILDISENDVLLCVLPLYHAASCMVMFSCVSAGLPKPVYMIQQSLISLTSIYQILDISENDVLLCVLPLYHSSACMIMFSCIGTGCSIVLRKKFSASEFWKDIHKYKVTMFQYIGELCRYLLSRPPSVLDTGHTVRAIMGNGLRKDIWEQFQSRFKIPLIAEFFASTDGNTMLAQFSNKPGALGRLSPFVRRLEPLPRRLVKYDYNTAEPKRDKNGRCIEIKPGEVGLLVSKLRPDRPTPIYKASEEANNKKIIRNAFVDGDEYFNYGDLLYLDKDYFVYFNDRIGDTFRWKGENVSTTEVSNILTDVDFIHDANVYGVTVPGQDGRAGMAAITLTTDQPITTQQLKQLFEHCEKHLPSYAVPRFLRHLKDAVLTVTFKQKKRDFVNEGFDPMNVPDPLYFRNVNNKTYVPITPDFYPSVLKSKL